MENPSFQNSLKLRKNQLYCFHKFFQKCREYIKTENSSYKVA